MNLDFWNKGLVKSFTIIPTNLGEESCLLDIFRVCGQLDWTKKYVKIDMAGKNLKISIDEIVIMPKSYKKTKKSKGWIEGEAGGKL
jgi:hypothetical protein